MGRFTVRLPDTLHRRLEWQAKQEGVSLNQYVVYALTQHTTPAYTIQMVPEADVQQQQERWQALLNQLGTPDGEVAAAFLAQREYEELEDEETAELIAKVEAKLATLKQQPKL